jgi:hypothetical protein
MNIYTVTIRHSTVTFDLLICAGSKKRAKKLAGKQIKSNYGPQFHICHIY